MEPNDALTVLKQKITQGLSVEPNFNPQPHLQAIFSQPTQNLNPQVQTAPQQTLKVGNQFIQPSPGSTAAPTPIGQPITQNPFSKILNAPVVKPIAQNIEGTINQVKSGYAGGAVKLAAADITHNAQARANAIQQFNQPALKLNQGLTKLPNGGYKVTKTDPTLINIAMGTEGGAKPLSADEKMFQSLGGNPKDLPNLLKMDAQQKADLDSRTQMALANFEKGQGTPLAPPEVNTARNPVKANLPVVESGDYSQVIANEQAASKPIQFAGDRWEAAMQKLTNDEKTNFWRAVETPGNYSRELNDAIDKWRAVDDSIHANSQELGGNTNYLTDHALHPWNLPEEFSDHIVNGGDPNKFSGINSLSRKYATIAEGEKAGLELGTDPIHEGRNYIGASQALLKRRAIVKGIGEADGMNPDKPHVFDLGGGNSIPVSEEARKALRGLQRSPASKNIVIKGARTLNTGLKSSILSLGQFHPINIAALRAAPTLALRGHPIRAAVGLSRTFRVLAPGGKSLAENVLSQAQKEGMDVKAAKIGMPYSAGGFDSEGSFIKGGLGHETVFGRQMPMMHDQVVRSIVSDLERKGINLDSAEARTAGKAGNNLMGFVNSEAQKIPPKVNRALGDWLLAKQFTASKFSQTRTAVTKGGVGGSYARANVAANVAATTIVIAGLGYAFHQKSDDLKDMLLRALIAPGVPSNQKDSKGNTVMYRTPGTDTSDIAKLLGISLVRNSDGHLGVTWKPDKILANNGTLYSYLTSRLSPFASSVVKIKTNQTYASKPLYDPNAPAGTKAIQGATSIATGLLPIGLQGAAFTTPIKNRLPGSSQEVLNAQTPGTNPLIKSIGSSFGLTPTTDPTVGKSLQTSQFFNIQDQALAGLNPNDKAAWNSIHPQSKNPVTGNYQTTPSVFDTPKKADTYLANPNVLAADNKINQTLAKQGQRVDPFFLLQPDHQKAYLEYQTMAPGGPDEINWKNNNSWYKTFDADRAAFFQTLPAGDPNKPKLSLQPPSASPQVQTLLNQYSQLTDPTQKASFINSNPSLSDFFGQTTKYTNDLRSARGLTPLKTYPTADPATESFTTQYMSSDKTTRSTLRANNPTAYTNMQNYLAQVSLFDLEKNAAVDQLQGNQPNQTELKSAYNLGHYDLAKNPDGTFSINPQEAAAQGQSQNKPLVPLPRIKHPRKIYIKRPPRAKKFRAPHIKKATRVKVQSRGQLRPTKIARPTQVVKLAR